jgi:hypothetical protein
MKYFAGYFKLTLSPEGSLPHTHPLYYSRFLFFLNKPKNNAPSKAKYKELFTGLEVMAHEPVKHPMYFQYRNPAMPPAKAPIA